MPTTEVTDFLSYSTYLGCSLQRIEIDDDGFDLTSDGRRVVHGGHGILGPAAHVDEQLVLVIADGHGNHVAVQLDHPFWQ